MWINLQFVLDLGSNLKNMALDSINVAISSNRSVSNKFGNVSSFIPSWPP